MSICPVCLNPTKKIWSKEKFSLYQLPSRSNGKKFYSDLNLLYCETCGHGHINPMPDLEVLKEFYASGYGGYTSPLGTSGITSGIVEPSIEFITAQIKKKWKEKTIRMVEVGGNDGYVLNRLKPFASEMLLIDPAREASEIAKRNGISFYNGFLNDFIASKSQKKFDLVISRHVIEHLHDPKAYFKQLLQLVDRDGILIIETPDIDCVIKNLLIRVITLQHLHYFSLESLERLTASDAKLTEFATIENYAEIASFTPIQLAASPSKNFKGPSNELKQMALSFSERLGKYFAKLTAIVDHWHRAGKRIWIWGAGSAGGEMFNLYGQKPEYFSGYIDSDPEKSTMRFPAALGLPIDTPEVAYKLGVDAILIASYSVQEILSKIKELGWDAEVADLYSSKVIYSPSAVQAAHGTAKADSKNRFV